MAAIVYEGVPGNGDLFAGRKFFIAQRVPSRNTLVQNVKSNGGEIVPLEKQADMIIADHARPKFAPENSYSWQYITESVKNGLLEDAAKHLIQSTSTFNAGSASRTSGHMIGGSRPIKPNRTPFTAVDDDVLRRWVAKAHERGIAVTGNKIYQQLERENKRHTWQSWKDRWMRYHRHKPHPDVSNDDGPGPVMEVVQGQPSRPRLGRHRQVDGAEDVEDDIDDQEASAQDSVNIQVRVPASRVPRVVEGEEFTQSDHDLLESEYEHILVIESKGVNVIRAWSAFARAHGRHTGDEWYAYFHMLLKPAMEKKLQKTTKTGNLKSEVIAIDYDDEEADEEADEKEEGTGAFNAESPQNVLDETPTPILLSRPPNMASVSKGSPTGRRTSSFSEYEGVSAQKRQDYSISEDKAAFLEDLRTIARATHKQIEPIQGVCGSQVQLYDLWSTVNDTFKSFENVDACDMWRRVATVLGFNISRQPEAAMRLRNLYTTFLVKVARLEKAGSARVAKAAEVANPIPASSPAKSTPKTEQKHTSSISVQKPTRVLPALCRNAPSGPHQEKSLGSAPPNVGGNASITHNSSPAKAISGAHPATNVRGGGQKDGHETTKAQPVPTRSEAPDESLKSFMENASNMVGEEELTNADKKFLGKLVIFAKECLRIEIKCTGVTICNRWVSLPKFQQVVHEYGGYDTVTERNLWKRVAYHLGYNPVARYKGVEKELHECYGEVLAEFDVFCEKVQQEKERRASLNVQGLQKLVDEYSDVLFSHTSPRQPGPSSLQRRTRKVAGDDGPANIQDTFKRRRVDRKGRGKKIPAEVPSTPEHIYNSSFASQEASVVKDSQVVDLVSDAESDGTEAFQPINRPIFKKTVAKLAPEVVEEPETQDFSFVSPGSPSQQLRPEAMTSVSPAVRTTKKATSPIYENEVVVAAEPDLQEFFAMCETKGYESEVAVQALSYANMNQFLAQKILSTVAKGQPIPDNIRGIWTTKDDEVLLRNLPVDHPEMVKLIKKHGSDELKERSEFHENLGEAAEDE